MSGKAGPVKSASGVKYIKNELKLINIVFIYLLIYFLP